MIMILKKLCFTFLWYRLVYEDKLFGPLFAGVGIVCHFEKQNLLKTIKNVVFFPYSVVL